MSAQKEGFTLIELLIVVSIITVLVGVLLIVIDPVAFRAKARDAKRLSDLRSIQTALELYKFDNKRYPTLSEWVWINGRTDTLTSSLKNYLNPIPFDSKMSAVGDACDNKIYGYRYRADSSGRSYVLIAQVEVESSAKSNLCTGLVSWSNLGCNATNLCVGFENRAE